MSDVLEYNCSLGKPGRRAVQDIDKLITGQDPDGDRPYYAHLGISMRGFFEAWIIMLFSDTSLHDSVFLMSNYSNLWHQLTTVYPKVHLSFGKHWLTVSQFVIVCQWPIWSIISLISGFQDQILLLNGNDFTAKPVEILQSVENFIGIPKFFSNDHFDFSGIFFNF